MICVENSVVEFLIKVRRSHQLANKLTELRPDAAQPSGTRVLITPNGKFSFVCDPKVIEL